MLQKKVFKYHAFGLRISSEVILSDLPIAHFSSSSEININLLQHPKLTELFKPLFSEVSYVVEHPQSVFFKIAHVGQAHVKNGRTITLDLLPQADLDVLRIYLLGSIFGVLLMQRGFFCVHASALSYEGKVFLFMGESGQGKSTTCKYFISKGFTYLGDDYLPIAITKDHAMAIPSFPQIKLWGDTLQMVNLQQNEFVKQIRSDVAKYNVFNFTTFSTETSPVAGIIQLEWNDENELLLNRLLPNEAQIACLKNIYRKELLPDLNLYSKAFLFARNLSERVPCYELTGKRSIKQLDHLLTNILTIAHEYILNC